MVEWTLIGLQLNTCIFHQKHSIGYSLFERSVGVIRGYISNRHLRNLFLLEIFNNLHLGTGNIIFCPWDWIHLNSLSSVLIPWWQLWKHPQLFSNFLTAQESNFLKNFKYISSFYETPTHAGFFSHSGIVEFKLFSTVEWKRKYFGPYSPSL